MGALSYLGVAELRAVAVPGVDAALQLPPQQGAGQQGDELEKLREMLTRAGPDGRADREGAVARLMTMPRPEAHRLLQEALQCGDDPDGLRPLILGALYQHLLGGVPQQFGGADATARAAILGGYLGALAPFWSHAGNGSGPDDDEDVELRVAARRALQRVPVRELDEAARQVLAAAVPTVQAQILRCLCDLQQTLLAGTIAEHLEAGDEAVRLAARDALRLLVYPDEVIRTKADFEVWKQQFGGMSYLDLVERAARRGPRPLERLREELARTRVAAARDLVTAYVERTAGVDWAQIQARTISDEPAVLDACLGALAGVLARVQIGEDNPATRQAFCRALLDRFRKIPAGQQEELQQRRARVLEVAAYLARPEEAELANEIRALLLAQLEQSAVSTGIGALRGLRRFPSPEARATLVRHALRLLTEPSPPKELLQAMFDTLASRTAPRWKAPAPDDADRAEWLSLVEKGCRSPAELELRTSALQLAQTLDGNEARVTEAFGILLALVRDPGLPARDRSTTLLYLEAWRSDTELAGRWIEAMIALLEDPAAELREKAADSLAKLPASGDRARTEWYEAILMVMRSRLAAEPDEKVLFAMIECVKACGREPQMPEKAIGVLRGVLDGLGTTVPVEQQFRLDQLLGALAAIANDPRAAGGPWLAACDPLLVHGRRRSLRLVLQSHSAIDLARQVDRKDDASAAERARRAMRTVIEVAVLKQARLAWTSSEELMREARDVRAAFAALDGIEPEGRLDGPQHRLLRLAVCLADKKWQEVVDRGKPWIDASPNGDPDFQDQVRVLVAEALLALNDADQARRLLEALSPGAAANPQALDLSARVAKALFKNDPTGAVKLFEAVLQATPPEDPNFRVRLVDWMRHRLMHEPASREAVLQRAERHADLFAAADCPAELREAFEQLRKPL